MLSHKKLVLKVNKSFACFNDGYLIRKTKGKTFVRAPTAPLAWKFAYRKLVNNA